MPGNTTDGDSETLTATFVSRRVIDCDGTPVRRLLVEEAGDQRALLVAPDAGAAVGLRTGETYAFTDVVFCPTATEPLDDACPACGGRLRRGTALDAWPEIRTAAERLDLECAGVLTAASTITEVPATTRDDARRPTADETMPSVPPAVCMCCGATAPRCSSR